MASHFTPRFKEAFDRVRAIAEKDGVEAGRRAFRDAMLQLGPDERCRNLYRVKDKLTSRPVFFQPNAQQEYYLSKRKGRDIILKPRQVGYTTLAGVRGVDKALWESNSACGIMAHHQGTVTTIFSDLVKFIYNWFKRDWKHLYSPVENSNNATELAFKHDGIDRVMDSSMRVLYDFRGKTVSYLHVSEASRVEDERLLGSLQGVPITGEVVLESTANGRGGNFYRVWQSWRNQGQSAPYKGHFIPWFTFYPEQSETWVPEDGTEWTDYEKGLMSAYPEITEAHLLWRRWCIEANCNGDPDQFENEYPSNDVDCFLTGEFSVFPSSLLRAQDKSCRDPLKKGFLISEDKKVTFHEDAHGTCSLWRTPDPAHTYVIGVDPAGGVGKDKAVAYVKDQQKKEIVAVIYGDIEPHDLAKELYKLGHFYNKAWMCVEANNHGHVVLQGLKDRGYVNLYRRKVLDEMTAKLTLKVGFLTTNDSKLRITEMLKTAMKEGDLTILDRNLVDEMSTFVQVAGKNGRTIRREAAGSAHDDRVMAAALMQEMDQARAEVDASIEREEADVMRDADYDEMTGMPV